jgi:hypothetical protein
MLNKVLHLIALADVGLSLALVVLVRKKYGPGVWSMLWNNLKSLFRKPPVVVYVENAAYDYDWHDVEECDCGCKDEEDDVG